MHSHLVGLKMKPVSRFINIMSHFEELKQLIYDRINIDSYSKVVNTLERDILFYRTRWSIYRKIQRNKTWQKSLR